MTVHRTQKRGSRLDSQTEKKKKTYGVCVLSVSLGKYTTLTRYLFCDRIGF